MTGPEFCANLSLGGPRTYPFDSDGDDIADVCSLPYTRREAIARQNAATVLTIRYDRPFAIAAREACAALAGSDFGDQPEQLAADACATGTLSPPPSAPPANTAFYTGIVTGPEFCANLSLGGPRTYPFDSDGDDIADVCSLPYTRREAIARQNAATVLTIRYDRPFAIAAREACAALAGSDFGDQPEQLAADACATGTLSPPPPVPPQTPIVNVIPGP